MVKFYRTFGVNVPVGSQIKIWGNIYYLDVIVLVITGMAIMMFQSWFSNCPSNIPYLVFSISTALLAIYLLIRPHTNPGKRNFELIIFTFMRTPHFFESINTAPAQPIRLHTMDYGAKRLPLSQRYQKVDRDHRYRRK